MVIFFFFYSFFFFCFVVAIFDLVQDVKAIFHIPSQLSASVHLF